MVMQFTVFLLLTFKGTYEVIKVANCTSLGLTGEGLVVFSLMDYGLLHLGTVLFTQNANNPVKFHFICTEKMV